MKLSIVTINYNNAEGLKRTLDSVKAQTYKEIEHIIIDGGSTDGSVEVIKDYVNQCMIYDVLWVSEKDNGIYHAMNKGIKRSSGEYVFILNSGDAFAAADVVERMMDILNDEMSRKMNDEPEVLNEPHLQCSMSRDKSLNDGVPILMGNIVQVYGDESKVREKKCCKDDDKKPKPIDVSMYTFYRGTVPQDAAFVRRDLYEKYGYFDETMKICADWKLYLDMIALGGVVPIYLDIDVVNFDMSGVSNTNNERRLAERRAYLEKVLPAAVLKDYDAYAAPIAQYNRIRKYHLWGVVHLLERILFKMEKWGVLHR